MTTIAIVEDTHEYRNFLQALVGSADGLECVGAFANAEDALANIPTLKPNIVLMDIGLPGMSGAECTIKLKALQPELLILMLTIFQDSDRIFQALQAGATGYLLKKTPPAEIVADIRDLSEGGAPMSSQIARKVVEAFQPDPLVQKLTGREKEILTFLSKGFSYKEIAERNSISVKTVNKHIYNIYQKLHVNSNIEAVAKFFGHR
ncbi:MAG: response regulator transcription factor [Ignavibacteria bacterium]|nr:response regulator transcription factor [Ignavibacteria bacterium]